MGATITNQINTIIASVLLFSPEKSISPPSIRIPDTLKGIDDLVRAGFESYRDSCFGWLLAATGVVVIGLICEGPELWHEIVSIISHWRFERKFHFSFPDEHASNKAKLLAFVGWLLIVGGVAGEFVADSFVSKADGYVQKFDEILLADAERQTEIAKIRAGGAYERATENEKEAAQLRKDAEDERLARTTLEEAIQPRDLSVQQQKAVASALHSVARMPVLVSMYSLDRESVALGTEIGLALKLAEVDVSIFPNSAPGLTVIPKGIWITGQNQALIGQLKDALTREGKLKLTDPSWKPLPFSGTVNDAFLDKAPEAMIFVGAKPIMLPSAKKTDSK